MPKTDQMVLDLPTELHNYVREQAGRDAYLSESDFVVNLVRERFRRDEGSVRRQAELDAALARGIADADAGRTIPLDEAFARLRDVVEAEAARRT